MTKILHISHAKEHSGWGIAALKDLQALNHKFDTVARYITYTTDCLESDFLQQMEQKNLENVTHVIQYVLPHEFQRFPFAKNIGYFEIESLDLSYSLWPECLHNLDEIWVINHEAASVVRKVTNLPIYVIPHVVETEIYKEDYKPFDIKQMRGNYCFYTIGENVPRKNLETLIAAYFIEFDPTEPCSLIIKTNDNLNDLILSVQKKINLYPQHADYAQIAVIDGRVDVDKIYAIHKRGDCYVNVSSGESWCLPLIDAMGFGNNIISLNEGGPADLLIGHEYLVSYSETWCHGHNNFPGFQNGLDKWKSVNFMDLRKNMRKSYEQRPKPTYNLDRFNQENFCKLIEERIKL